MNTHSIHQAEYCAEIKMQSTVELSTARQREAHGREEQERWIFTPKPLLAEWMNDPPSHMAMISTQARRGKIYVLQQEENNLRLKSCYLLDKKGVKKKKD